MTKPKNKQAKIKPSERIKELAEQAKQEGIDPGFYGGQLAVHHWVAGIVKYLDETK